MSYRSYRVNLDMPYFNQTYDSTWTEIDEGYKKDFIANGCALCAYTMCMAQRDNDQSYRPIDAINDGAARMYSCQLRDWAPLSITERGLAYSTNIRKICESLILDEEAVVIHVDGHYVTAKGFRGTLPMDSDGFPILSAATSDMIKVNDPYYEDNKTLEDVEDIYGKKIINLRV